MKTIQWFLLLTRCHFQPLVTFGPSWLQMAPGERQKPFHFLHTRVLFICRKCAEILSTEILFLYFHGNIMGRKRTNRGVSGFIIWIFPDNLSMEILWGKNGFINMSGNAHLIFPRKYYKVRSGNIQINLSTEILLGENGFINLSAIVR